MKKLLLMLLMVVCWNNLFAFLSQGHWRWRKDDGSETAATWLGAQDETVTITSGSDNIRLRIELYNDDANTNDPKDAVLEYALDGTDTWFTITNTVGTNAFVLSGTSPNVTDLEPTTQQIIGVGLAFEPGKVMVSSEKIPSDVVSAHAETEYEYCIKPTSNIAVNTTYQFRVEATNHNEGFIPPKLKTAAVLPVSFTGFNLQQQDGKVKINWSTGSEENNDHFTIERSSDANSWVTVSTVKARGTTGASSYNVTDDKPLGGRNYYRIVQHDKDGRISTSDVKNITLQKKAIFNASVYPNPVVNSINLSFQNYSGILNAVLTNTAGAVVLSRQISVGGTLGGYTLNLNSKPAAGVYLLQLTADGLSQTIKVVIQ